MGTYRVVLAGVLIFLTGLGCDQYDPADLVGQWQAVYIEEEGNPMPISVSPVRIRFFADGTYSYHSTLKYSEAGTYYLKDAHLYRTDTLNAASREKVVEVVRLQADTLSFRMMEKGRERILKLARLH